MKNFNKSKLFFAGLAVIALLPITMAYQNFNSGPSLNETTKKDNTMGDALAAAMQTAEQDHLKKQMALNVTPDQVEADIKARRGERKIATVKVDADIDVETSDTARAVKPAPEEEEFDIENAEPAE